MTDSTKILAAIAAKQYLHKRADAATDILAGTTTNLAMMAAPAVAGYKLGESVTKDAPPFERDMLRGGLAIQGLGLGNTAATGANLVGGIFGLAGSDDDDRAVDALREISKAKARALLPGVAAHRIQRRARLVAKALKSGKNKYLHENLSMMNPLNILGIAPAAIAAAVTPTRTLEEQLEEESDSPVKDWLIPGVGFYNQLKRLGVSNRLADSKDGDVTDLELQRLLKQQKKLN